MLGLVALTMVIMYFLPKITHAIPAGLAAIIIRRPAQPVRHRRCDIPADFYHVCIRFNRHGAGSGTGGIDVHGGYRNF